jgi:hypothetical protein
VLERTAASDLARAPGALHGLTYPLVPDLEGMMSPRFAVLLDTLARADWQGRLPWLRIVGLDAFVAFEDPAVPGYRRLDAVARHGVATGLFAVEAPAPPAWWPQRVVAAPKPEAAVAAVARAPDPIATVAGPAVDHAPGGRVRLLRSSPDRIELEVEGGGGVAVVRRAYQPLLVARSEAGPLVTAPVDLVLLGIVVPPGSHRVTIAATAWPEALAGVVALAAAAALLLATAKRRPRRRLPR